LEKGSSPKIVDDIKRKSTTRYGEGSLKWKKM